MTFLQTKKDKLIELHQRKPWLAGSAFFIFGVLFDIITLNRIDDLFNITQQGIYLLLLTALLYLEFFDEGLLQRVPQKIKIFWKYKEELIHFLFGSLLSVYTIFYIQSASFFASAFFLAIFCGILVANEMPQFRNFGLSLRSALLCLCYLSYFSYLMPLIWGDIGWIPFSLAIVSTGVLIFLLQFLLRRKRIEREWINKKFFYPSMMVCISFLLLYWAAWIPPLPLSLQYIGIYHHVQKTGGVYKLAHQNPWWRFWSYGDQNFIWRKGDKVYLFIRIFSPGSFSSKIFLRWSYFENNKTWREWDRIPIQISGGRNEGFRGVAVKENVKAGDWRVQVETKDGREVGRIYFSIEEDTSLGEREFRFDEY